MRRTHLVIILAGLAWIAEAPATAQSTDAATRARLRTLVTAAANTPEGKGLVFVALAEAQTALAQAVLAEQATKDLSAMQQYAAGVLHAVDASGTGPGAGYGLQRALAELIEQIEDTATADTKADVTQLAPRALTAARAAQRDVESLAGLAQGLRAAQTTQDAVPLAQQLRAIAQRVIAGSSSTAERTPKTAGPGGLLAVRASLVVLTMGREKALPAAARQTGVAQ